MTSIEWLANKLSITFKTMYADEIEQAKEMHKQEIIDACIEFGNLNGVDIEDYEQYYQETFVSKGSDDHISDVSKMVELPQQEKTLSDKWKEYQDWLNEIPEISDEEIKKGAIDYLIHIKEEFTDLAITSFITGCVWYREQLKSKGNGK